MKYLLLMALLLLAVPVGAGSGPVSMYDPVAAKVIDCFFDGQSFPPRADGMCHGVDAQAAPCLAKMEAAMRAMEPWLSRWHISGDGNMTWMDDRRIDSETLLPLNFSTDPNDPSMKQFFEEQEAARLKAFEQWNAAKACWRTP